MARVPKLFANSAGGLNTGLHPLSLRANEYAELTNFFVKGDSIYPKQGSTRILSTPLAFPKTFGPYRAPSGDFKLVAFGDDINIVNHAAAPSPPIPLTCRYGAAYNNSFRRPFMIQIEGIWYMSDAAGGPLRRGTDSYYETAGIPAPTTAVTIADGGAGIMTTANYRVVVTWQNSATADESDYSVLSNTLALGASRQILVTGIPVSTTPQVDKVRIWLSPPNQVNTFLLVATLANGTTSYTINAAVSDLQDLLPNTNNVPPSNVVALAFFDDRLFVTDGDYLYASGYQQYETFDTVNDIQPILSADGHDCNILYTWGSRLIAGKPNYVVYFTATGTGDYIPTILSDKYGVRSPHAMKSKENTLLWFDGAKFIRSDSGSTPKDISGIRIKRYLDAIPDDKIDDLVAEIVPRDGLYLVSIPQPDNTAVELAYNYDDDAWSVFDFANNPIFFSEGYKNDGSRQIYCLTGDGYIDNILDSASSTDGGVPITYSFVTRGISGTDNPIERTWLQHFSILCTNIGRTVTLSVKENGLSSAINTISAYIYSATNEWKTFKLSTFRRTKGASFIQVAFSFTGTLPATFKITSFIFDLFTRAHSQQPKLPSQS